MKIGNREREREREEIYGGTKKSKREGNEKGEECYGERRGRGRK